MRNVLRIGMLCAAVCLTSGCAFGTRRVSLALADPSGFESSPASQSTSVGIGRPQDLRVETESVGCVRNGWGMRTAEVVADRNVPEWVQDNVASALQASGFKVQKSDATDAPGDCDVAVVLSVDKAFCELYARYKAEVRIGAEIHVKGERIHRGNYKGEFSSMCWAASSAGYEKTLNSAMKDCLDKMIPELSRLIQANAKKGGNS